MKKKVMVENISTIQGEIQICETCQLDNQLRLLFSKGQAWRVNQKLQLIYTNMYGLMKIALLCDNRHFILFIDYYNRMC